MCQACSNRQLVGLLLKARRVRDLSGLLAKQGEGGFEGGLDFELGEEDGEAFGSVWAVYASALGQAEALAARGELTEAERQRLAAAALAQAEEGLALLSDSARQRLGPLVTWINEALQGMVEGSINPLQAAARMQEALRGAMEAGATAPPGQYTPYEWSRLCRTEAQFARSAAVLEEFKAGGSDSSVVESLGAVPPLHPSCMCSLGELEVGGKAWVILMPTPTACAICLDMAEQVTSAIGL